MFSLILPFHRDAARLTATLEIVSTSRRSEIGEVLLCHNGKALAPSEEAALRAQLTANVQLHHTDMPGIGAGYRLGIFRAQQPYVVLSASDLPFGFSDLDAYLELIRKGRNAAFAIGSKLHPQTVMTGYPWTRRAGTYAFYFLRRALLGRGTPRDSQGTLLLETALARALVNDVEANDYFFSLELVSLAIARGVQVIELPVTYSPGDTDSAVRMGRDGLEMARRTWALKRRLG